MEDTRDDDRETDPSLAEAATTAAEDGVATPKLAADSALADRFVLDRAS